MSAAAALVKLENPSAGKSAVKSYLDSISVDLGAEGRDVYCGNGCPKFAAYSGGSQGGDEPGGDEPGGNEPGGTEPEPVVVTINLAKSGKLSGLKNATYTGKAIYPSPVVTCEGKTLKRNTDYTVSYKNYRNVGTATVTVKGKGNYTGTLTGTFKILPKGTTISKLTRASKAITVNWKKQSTKMSTTLITGYQIQLATDSKFTKNKKTVTVQGYSKTSTKVTKLKAKTRYYVRIRTYKSINGTKYYSLWSAAKYITTN
ncbi:MAG: fibronectin type III domain-containing protein [Mogibacterium sp.]|nr:fibronectin type III domain-containing protein [Mogibacterium sp.]